MIRQILIAGVFFFLAATAEAASFDCRKAKTAFEKAICANADLSELDEEMSAKYHAALKGLSSQGAQSLRQSQRHWLSVADNCTVSSTVDTCLLLLYRGRVDDLAIKAQTVGPYRFIRLFNYAFEENQDETIRAENPIALFKAPYPQIDLPVRTVLGEWNAQIADIPVATECGTDGGKVDSGTEINQATDRLLSVTASFYYYCTGMAHGQGGSRNLTYILAPRLKLLEAEDVFSAETDWLNSLTQLCMDALGEFFQVIQFWRVKAVAADPTNWLLRKEGLEVSFGVYTIGAYAEGDHDILIPWDQLKPYLRSDAPIPQ